MTIDAAQIISLLAIILSVGINIIQWGSLSRQQRADATDKISHAYGELFENFEVRIKALEIDKTALIKDIESIKRELARYRTWNARLQKQIIEEFHGVPVSMESTKDVK